MEVKKVANNTTLIVGVVVALFISGLVGYYSVSPKEVVREVTVLGTEVSVQASGEGIWMLPGKRELDTEIFGTPGNPLKTNLLPVGMREVSEDGSSFTTTAGMGPFSDNVKEITGTISLSVKDLTTLDDTNSKDEAQLEATFTDPTGQDTYRVVLKKLIPVGPDHQFFGGVGTDVLIHGSSEVGTPLMPTMWNYVALWGFGDLHKNGELIDSMRIIHVMVTPRHRDDDFKLGFGVAKPSELEIHLILPPNKASPSGPVDSPVPTGFVLPNGMEQPFIHVNYYGNIDIEGDRYLG
ncbi:MAG: hypothetical protein ACE5G7_01065 [Candidatus Hydrothermarchaeaceae archaeon]